MGCNLIAVRYTIIKIFVSNCGKIIMEKYFKLFYFLLISLFLISCGKKNNPTDSNGSSNKWKEIAKIDEVSNPKLHFINEEEGIIVGQVSYDIMHVLGPPSLLGYGKDTVVYIQNKLVSTTPDTKKYPLWKTYDSGKTWIPIKGFFQTSIKDLYFVDNITGFLITEEEGVFETTDGGDSWTRIFGAELLFYTVSGNSGSIGNSIPEEVSSYGSDNNIISMTYGPKGRLYLVTNDGGVNWDFNYLSFKVNNINFPEKNIKTGYGSSYNSIVKTKDGGLTWDVIAEGLNWPPQFSFYDINNGIYYNDGKIYLTSDGGATFKEVYDFKENSNELRGIFSLPPDKIYYSKTSCHILDNGSIIKSTDDCNTFQVINASDVSGLYFSDFSIPDENTIYAISIDGGLYEYNNKE